MPWSVKSRARRDWGSLLVPRRVAEAGLKFNDKKTEKKFRLHLFYFCEKVT